MSHLIVEFSEQETDHFLDSSHCIFSVPFNIARFVRGVHKEVSVKSLYNIPTPLKVCVPDEVVLVNLGYPTHAVSCNFVIFTFQLAARLLHKITQFSLVIENQYRPMYII